MGDKADKVGRPEPQIYRVQCQGRASGCRGMFETTSKFAKTCSGACRQKKWRGTVITTDEPHLTRAFGDDAAERLQATYQD